MQGVQVQPLVRELDPTTKSSHATTERSHVPQLTLGTAKQMPFFLMLTKNSIGYVKLTLLPIQFFF